LYNELNNLRTDQDSNNWIAPWPSYAGESSCSQIDNQTLSCNMIGLPLKIDLTTMDAKVGIAGKIAYPVSFAYVDSNGTFMEKRYTKDYYWDVYSQEFASQGIKDIPRISVVLRLDHSGIIQSSSELAGSMFTRLFYLEGAGLSHFEKISDVTDIQGQRIIVWKVKW
jgi:hypothetical protein